MPASKTVHGPAEMLKFYRPFDTMFIMPQRRFIIDGTEICIRDTEHPDALLKLAMESSSPSSSTSKGVRGATTVVSINGADYAVKEYFRGGLISFLQNRHLSRDQLKNETEIIDYLRQRGFNVPEVAASITVKGFPWSKYILITKQIRGVRHLTHADIADSKTLRKLCLSIKRLHEVGVYHGDLNLTNILYGGGGFYLLDFASSRFSFSVNDHRRDIFRFIRSIEKIMGDKLGPFAKARILRYYYGGNKNIRKLIRQYNIHSMAHKLSWKVLGKS